jgi:hypothetical protein
MHDHASGLVHDEEMRVFVDDRERQGLRKDLRGARRRNVDLDPIPAGYRF